MKAQIGLTYFLAAQGLQGLQPFFFAAQGLQAPQPFFFAAQGLQAPQPFLAEQGLQAFLGPQPAIAVGRTVVAAMVAIAAEVKSSLSIGSCLRLER